MDINAMAPINAVDFALMAIVIKMTVVVAVVAQTGPHATLTMTVAALASAASVIKVVTTPAAKMV